VKRQRLEPAAPLVDFAGLYRDHAHAVRRFALFLCGDAMLADDLCRSSCVVSSTASATSIPRRTRRRSASSA
jgi:DNA-directed RNA polymerase specialized sigma24 family protein